MQYVGSKSRHAKEIISVMSSGSTLGAYVEPFVGGANMIDKVDARLRVGNDICPMVITLLSAVRDGWIPPESISEEEYAEAKANQDGSARNAFIGFLCSFGSKWFGGYARSKDGKNYAAIGHRSLIKQSENLKGIVFSNLDYREVLIPRGATLYCDPPYKGVTGYSSGAFDHDEFWEWCRRGAYSGDRLFVSEYQAPEDFVCVWSKKTTSNIDSRSSNFDRIERLFVHESQHGR